MTRDFALSLVTPMPQLASDTMLRALDSVALSTTASRHRTPRLYAILIFTSPVSMFTSRSTGMIGCGQTVSMPPFSA